MATPPLGWIEPSQRTKDQADAHALALAQMPNFALPPVQTAGPVKVDLTQLWKDPDVMVDIGCEFTGFGQYTGSCVGVSEGDGIFTLGAVQRKIADNPTKAFIPWWGYPYGRTRYNEGDRGQGEGAVDSVMGQTLIKEGVFDINEPGLPQFTKRDADGFWLTKTIEYQWSDGGSSTVMKFQSVAKQHPLGAAAALYSAQDIKTAILNGYPVLTGCSMYCGNGHIKGSGDTAYVTGTHDGRGGHSTCYLAYWDHPSDGPLYLYSNQWPTNTYPRDPAGAGRCCVWHTEAEVEKRFTRWGAGDGETMALSHLNWFPAQVEKILDWAQIL